MRRRFISLEGSEACGKTTQIERLRNTLVTLGHPVLLTREPGGTPLGETIRHLLKHAEEGRGMCAETELLLFTASRAQLARQVIAPALAEGQWVISDRYGDSTEVYQGVARRLPSESVRQVNRLAMGEMTPGLTLVLDLSIEEAQKRLRKRPRPVLQPDRMEQEPMEFYENVRRGYLNLAKQEPDRVRIVPAAGKVDEVAALIWQEVAHAFSL